MGIIIKVELRPATSCVLKINAAMPSQEDLNNQQAQLLVRRRTLQAWLLQQGKLGAFAPAYISVEIQDQRAAIQQIKMTLRGWGEPVEDLPDDGELSSAGQLGGALQNMADLLQSSSSRSQFEQFRTNLMLLNQQLQVLQTYKDLHDQLHQLQFGCYRPMMVGASEFPRNPTFIESLRLYSVELQLAIDELRTISDRPQTAPAEQHWINQLAQAQERLDLALANLERAPFDQAIYLIERVINLQPTRINERLKAIARELPFDALVHMLAAAQQAAETESGSTGQASAIGQGIAAVEQVRARLAQLIDEHDTWQRFEPDLRQYENDPSQYAARFAWLWQQDLKPSLTVIYQRRSDRWTRELQRLGEALEAALTSPTSRQLSEAGRAFYSCFGKCFFQADKELKDQCGQLRLIDGPLKSVIGMFL